MPSRLMHVAPHVLVATSRWYATTTTVLLDGAGGAVVVDPAWDPDELAAIPADLAELGVRCVAGVSTHRHYDHILWHEDLGDVPRWSTAGTVDAVTRDREAAIAPLAAFLTPDLIAIAGRLRPLPGDVLPWDGPAARILQHDAHAPAHLALALDGSGIVVVGDMLSDVELPMPADDDATLDRYVSGLDVLADTVRSAELLVPGHGTPTRQPVARLDADRRYLDALLAGRASDDPRIADPENRALHEANLARARNR